MIDREDRELLAVWALKAVALMIAVFGSAVVAGAAWRLFELVRG